MRASIARRNSFECADDRSRTARVCQPLCVLSRHNRRRRRARAVNCDARAGAHRRRADDGDPAGAADGGHAGVRKPVCTRNARSDCILADATPARRIGTHTNQDCADDWRFAGRPDPQSGDRRYAVAGWRPEAPSAPQGRESVPPGNLTDGLAQLQRRDKGLPAQRAHPDFEKQCRAHHSKMDLQSAQYADTAGDSCRG